MDVKLVATRWNSTSLDRSAVRASADLIDVTETGTQRVTISIFYNNEAEGITKKSTSPSMATVNIRGLYRGGGPLRAGGHCGRGLLRR